MLPLEQKLLDYIFKDEGGFANVKGDAGGKTKYGVTEWLARRYGYTGEMEALPLDLASSILLHEYWYPNWRQIAMPDQQNNLGYDPHRARPRLAVKLCDTQMNMPPSEAVKIAQRAVNRVAALSFVTVTEDGLLGPGTVAALLSPSYPEEALLRAVCVEQEAHYEWLEQHYKNDVQFAKGWRRRAFRIPDTNLEPVDVQL